MSTEIIKLKRKSQYLLSFLRLQPVMDKKYKIWIKSKSKSNLLVCLYQKNCQTSGTMGTDNQ